MLHRQIYNIVYQLPAPYKEVVSLRYFSGNSCGEIASLLGRSVGTITKQISRGHALVAQQLKALQGYTTLLHFMLPKEGVDGN
jgi:DNA-directed RNA polymerase specialized sigma24 family protein